MDFDPDDVPLDVPLDVSLIKDLVLTMREVGVRRASAIRHTTRHSHHSSGNSMKKLIFLVLALFIATAATAQSVQYEPVAPTTRDAVTLWISVSWTYLCDPDAVNAGVAGHAITVTIVAKKAGCSIGFPYPGHDWSGKRTIGPLEPGVYTVTTRFDTGSTSIGTLQQPPLIVREANDSLTVLTTDILPAMTRVHLHSDRSLFCITSPCTAASVRIGNVNATDVTVPSQNEAIATFPRLDPGTYDVSLTFNGLTTALAAALQVIDPGAAPYPQMRSLEWILIPVLFSAPGAYGSQWTTDVAVTNAEIVPIDFYRSPFGSAGPLQPGETRMITTSLVGQRPNGLFLYVPRGESKSIQFNALVRDLSHQSEALGAELPIVREWQFFHQRFNLLNVPADPRFRVALRAYSLGSTPAIVTIYKIGEALPIITDIIAIPFTPGDPDGASSLVITDLVAKYPKLAGAGPLRIQIERQYEGNFGPGDLGLWAFASVTNNDTQHVTIISPQ